MEINTNKPASWFANHKRILLRVIAIVVAVVILFYGFLIFLSYRAADLFNYVVRERQLFPGNVGTCLFQRLALGKRGRAALGRHPRGHVQGQDSRHRAHENRHTDRHGPHCEQGIYSSRARQQHGARRRQVEPREQAEK